MPVDYGQANVSARLKLGSGTVLAGGVAGGDEEGEFA